MATTQPHDSLPQRLGQQLLSPLEDALGLVRRYRELDSFQDYVRANLRLVAPAGLLILIAAAACGLTPIMLLVGTRVAASLGGLLLAPVVLLGSLFVLALVFFSWLEERALARSLGHRTGPGSQSDSSQTATGTDTRRPARRRTELRIVIPNPSCPYTPGAIQELERVLAGTTRKCRSHPP